MNDGLLDNRTESYFRNYVLIIGLFVATAMLLALMNVDIKKSGGTAKASCHFIAYTDLSNMNAQKDLLS